MSVTTISNGITIIDRDTFGGCNLLTDITIPESVKTIEYYAFYNCEMLESITLPENTTNISSSAFSGSGLKTIYGTSGSYAETFATENRYTFIAQS